MAKIAVAEDNPIWRIEVAEIISNMGHAPVLCSNGKHAWMTLEADHDIQLLVTDIFMPVINGIDLVRIIRSSSRLEKLPVIMISNHLNLKNIITLLEEGVDSFLHKPVNADQLRSEIEKHLEQTEITPGKKVLA